MTGIVLEHQWPAEFHERGIYYRIGFSFSVPILKRYDVCNYESCRCDMFYAFTSGCMIVPWIVTEFSFALKRQCLSAVWSHVDVISEIVNSGLLFSF